MAERGTFLDRAEAQRLLDLSFRGVDELIGLVELERLSEAGDYEEVEAMGLALTKLEETVHELAQRFGLRSEDLNLDLGPLGRLV